MDPLPIAPFLRVHQDLPGPRLERERLAVRVFEGVRALVGPLAREAGGRPAIAVAVGSRGIRDLELVVRTAVEALWAGGAAPFVVPAMGSHGGATAAGQERVLEALGITEERVGCPIRSALETVDLAEPGDPHPLHVDRLAYAADGVLLINRVKPHTKFRGPIESGLCKMLLIGLGKASGAALYHRAIEHASFQEILERNVPRVLARCRVLGGVALLENGREETADVAVVPAARLLADEPRLLERARAWLARLPLEAIDLLLVDEMGKDVSGSGMDTNVIGRRADDHRSQPDERPRVLRIAVRSLTPGSHGNALGIGLADFCTQRLIDAADLGATRVNALTSLHLTAARLPFVYPNDRAMLAAALGTLGLRAPQDARIAWIRNTLDLRTFECTRPCLPDLADRPGVRVLDAERGLTFDAHGDAPTLVDFRA